MQVNEIILKSYWKPGSNVTELSNGTISRASEPQEMGCSGVKTGLNVTGSLRLSLFDRDGGGWLAIETTALRRCSLYNYFREV